MAQGHLGPLHALRNAQSRYGILQLNAPWALEIHEWVPSTQFLVVEPGGCVFRMIDGTEHALRSGDVVIVPRGGGAFISGTSQVEALRFEALWSDKASSEFAVMRNGATGSGTLMICRSTAFEHAAVKRLFERLPPVIRPEAASDVHAEWIDRTLSRVAAEVADPRQGNGVMAMHLTDALVIEAVRAWIDRNPHVLNDGLIMALDRRIAHAVDLMHQEPERDWSLESLSRIVGMSRSVFAQRFTDVVGQPAMRYLANLRMTLALARLNDGAESVSAIGRRLGYSSEAAFSRAFLRHQGVSPSVVRRSRRSSTRLSEPGSGLT